MLTTHKSCQKNAWKQYHKFECALFSKTPRLPTLTQALCRLLCKLERGLISQEQDLGLSKLESHSAEYISGADKLRIASIAHGARTLLGVGTTLSSPHVAALYCIVRVTIHPYSHISLLTQCSATYQLHNYSPSGSKVPRIERRHYLITYQSLLQSKRVRCV